MISILTGKAENNDDFFSSFGKNFKNRDYSGFFREEITIQIGPSWKNLIPETILNAKVSFTSNLYAPIQTLKSAKTKNTPWTVFGFSSSVFTQKELEKAARKLKLQVHPDKNLEEQELAQELFSTVSKVEEYLIPLAKK